MATAFAINDDAQTAIAVLVEHNPVIVLTDEAKRDSLFAHIQREMDEFVPDLSTKKGRDAITSFAFKITRTKTAIDNAGKKLNEQARAQINVVDAARRDAREKLDAMAKAVRQPLTDWETAEDDRISRCRDVIAWLKAAAVVTIADTAAAIRERGMEVWGKELPADDFRDLLPEAQGAKDHAVSTLKEALARLTREEEERAELEKLRAEKEERDRADAERRAEEERVAHEIEQARIAEERRLETEKAEADRIAQAERDAADRPAVKLRQKPNARSTTSGAHGKRQRLRQSASLTSRPRTKRQRPTGSLPWKPSASAAKPTRRTASPS